MSVISALRLSHVPAPAFAVLGLCWGAFAAQVPAIKAALGVSDALFGALLLGSAGGLVTAMWLAPLVDRLLGPRALPLALVSLGAAFLLPGLATGPVAFLAAMLLVGVASGLSDVVMNARVSELEERHARPLMNANHGMFSVAYAISAVLTGLAREAGWPPVTVFAVILGATLMIAPVTAGRVGAAAAPEEADTGSFPGGLVWLCGLVVLAGFGTEAAVEAWSALHIERTLGGAPAEGALGPAVLGLTMAVGRFGGQAVAERMSERRVVLWASILAALGAMMAAAAPAPWAAYLGFGVLGLGVSVIGPIGIALAGRLVPAAARTRAISRAAVVGFSGFFLAPPIMGVTAEIASLRWSFVLIGLLVLVCLPLMAAIRHRAGGRV